VFGGCFDDVDLDRVGFGVGDLVFEVDCDFA